MSPPLARDDPDWAELIKLAREGFEWTARAEEQRSTELHIAKRGAAEQFLIEYLAARSPVNRTKWGKKDIYPGQVNYEIRADFEGQKVYIKFCIAQRRRSPALLITSFKRA